tara:strand:+ start:4393 stop:5025 length:633 start_codon:yes stop_codon:yes gene_type:complete
MIREYFSNDILTLLLLTSILLIILFKKINNQIFFLTVSIQKKNLLNKLSNNDNLSIHFINFGYYIIFLINLSILFTVFLENKFKIEVFKSLIIYFTIFYIIKYFFERLIGWLFKFRRTSKNYLYAKFVFNNSLGLLILALNLLIVYTTIFGEKLVYISLAIALFFLIISYFYIFFSFKKLVYKNWFYFILYLCTLEIIPYYFIINEILNM